MIASHAMIKFVLVSLAVGTLSGCLDSDGGESHGPQTGVGRQELPGMPLTGVIIHSDNDDIVNIKGKFRSTAPYVERCSDPIVAARGFHVIINIYDRHGLIDQVYRNLSWRAEGSWNLRLDLAGVYPHIVIGETTQCVGTGSLIGFEAGAAQHIWGNATGSLPATRRDDVDQISVQVPMRIPAGGQTLQAEWMPGPFVWRVFQPFLFVEQGRTGGTLEFVNSAGHMARSFNVSWTGQWDYHLSGPSFLYPGAYKLEMNLDQPAIMPVEWVFQVDTSEFDDGVCALDIEWSLCSG